MKNKINSRLVGIAVLAVIATLIGITLVCYSLFQSRVQADLKVSAELLKDTCYFESADMDTEKIDLSTDLKDLRVTWVDSDGTVLYDNDTSASLMENHMNRPEIREAFTDGSGSSVRESDTMKRNTFYYALLLDNGTVIRVATDAESLWSVFTSVMPIIAVIILLIIGICIVISHMLTRQLISPIEQMAADLEDSEYRSPYRELDPLSETLRTQHTAVLAAAKARQDFTANVSHELKTPLTAVSGYAQLLESGMVVEEQKGHFYREIRKNSDRLLALINDIIRLSELDRTETEPAFEDLDLYGAVDDCMEALSENARQREVELTFTGEACPIHGNRDMLKELTENLVQNAIRYNNPGGHVRVSVLVREGRPALSVEDDGIGIPAPEQERIFERFYRVDKSRSKATGGTGLGLAIVKHIVEIHDGKIELESEPGKGTTVTVLF